jgi:hypothetical protein
MDKRYETKVVRHVFTDVEKLDLGQQLARENDNLESIEGNFEEVKAEYKAKVAASEAKSKLLFQYVRNGFQTKEARCWATLLPKIGKKEWRLEGQDETAEPVLVEPMEPHDYQLELIRGEARFSHREELQLFLPVDSDAGILAVGMFKDRWYGAIRMTLSGKTLDERLNPEAKAVKHRKDCVRVHAKRALEWIRETHGDDVAEGFAGSINALIADNSERAE